MIPIQLQSHLKTHGEQYWDIATPLGDGSSAELIVDQEAIRWDVDVHGKTPAHPPYFTSILPGFPQIHLFSSLATWLFDIIAMGKGKGSTSTAMTELRLGTWRNDPTKHERH